MKCNLVGYTAICQQEKEIITQTAGMLETSTQGLARGKRTS